MVPRLGHFCLCYRDQRLVNEKTIIRNLGLNNGDQVFVDRPLSYEQKIQESCRRYIELEVETNANQNQNDVDNVADKGYPGAQDEFPPPEYRLVHLIKGWLPYAGHWGVSRKGPESRIRPSRFSFKHFSGRPKITL